MKEIICQWYIVHSKLKPFLVQMFLSWHISHYSERVLGTFYVVSRPLDDY